MFLPIMPEEEAAFLCISIAAAAAEKFEQHEDITYILE